MRSAVHSCPGEMELLLALQRMGFLGADERRLLLDTLRQASDLAGLSARDLRSLVGRDIPALEWDSGALLDAASRDREILERRGIRYLQFDQPGFPPLLKVIHRPPFGLYVRGRLPDPERPSVAIVGTRNASRAGMEAAEDLASELSGEGFPVVSGLARGIDSAAHRAAARRAGSTCAVLPSGPDRVYPPRNRELAALILGSGGCLLTEYPPGAEVHKYRFPDRNRLIAGMARACVVIEAPAKSGALITADHALEEGRDVFVHSACLGGARNAGADALREQGAKAVGSADELLADWGLERLRTAPPRMDRDAIRGTRASMDALMRELGLSPDAAGNKESSQYGH